MTVGEGDSGMGRETKVDVVVVQCGGVAHHLCRCSPLPETVSPPPSHVRRAGVRYWYQCEGWGQTHHGHVPRWC